MTQEPQTGGSITPGDILFVLFRHKWKIIICSFLGFCAGFGMWVKGKLEPTFESQTKILVKYVADTKSPLDSAASGDMIRTPADPRGGSVIGGEIAILTSSDLLVDTVQQVGIKDILGENAGKAKLQDAVRAVAKSLEVAPENGGGVIELTYRHRDPQVAQRILDSIIKNYRRKHVEVHRGGDGYDDLQQQTEALQGSLFQTEEELRREKSKLGIIDIAKAKDEIALRVSNTSTAIESTGAELAEKRAQLDAYHATAPVAADIVTNLPAKETNAIPSAPSEIEIAKYNALAQRLTALKANETNLRATYEDESKPVKEIRAQIEDAERELKALGINPARIPASVVLATPGAASPVKALDLDAMRADIRAQEVKYRFLTNQLARQRAELSSIEAAEGSIDHLELKKDVEQSQYTYWAKSLQQVKFDSQIDATKLNNIRIIQEPTFGAPSIDKKKKKIILGILGGGIGLGLGLAFLIDFVLDPSVKRSKDLETSLRLPVFANIPNFERNGHKHALAKAGNGALQNGDTWSNGEIAPWDETDPMLPYYEALRDRIVMSYGPDPHKPKIVGLTSCNKGAGVTRLATGLAAALSRDVQRNVLFIGLEKNKVSVSAFAKGQPAAALEKNGHAADSAALVHQDLESLVTTGRNRAGASIVQSFSDLMPKLSVSDYDYIIFDLPPIAQTTGSVRLASQMERTLLVVEGEKTPKDKVKKVKELLASSKTQLVAVLNKGKAYGPKSLNEDI